MTNNTKLKLSEQEAELIKSTDWILTKQSALLKIEQLLAGQIPLIQQLAASSILSVPAIAAAQPKMSRGEKYLSLPWVMLDYPAVFGKRDVFALRTMFWWGNLFSVTLHVSGSYKDAFGSQILKQLTKQADIPFYYCIGADEWAHHFETSNYLPARQCVQEGLVDDERNFCKIALKFPLDNWNNWETSLIQAYRNIFVLLQQQ